MNSIQVIPYSGNPAAPYTGAGTKKTFAQWQINDSFQFSFGGSEPDFVKLIFSGQDSADDIFPYRALVKIVHNDKPFFTGVVPEDAVHVKAGNKNEQQILLKGPLWFLQRIPYRQLYRVVTAIDANGNPTYQDFLATHFRLNLPLTPNIVHTPPTYSLFYTPTLWNSAQQIADALSYAAARGAYLAYELPNLMAVPVEPADVLNIHCWDAIRKQMDNYDCICWFDYTQDPPQFHLQRRSQLAALSKQKGNGGAVQSRSLKKRSDLKVPFVQITYEQPYNLGNGIQGMSVVTYIYPPPAGSTPVIVDVGGGVMFTAYSPPAVNLGNPPDELNALVTTIPLQGINQTTFTKYIQTDVVAPNDITWWQRRRPEMNPAINPNAAIDYANLAIVPNSGARQLEPNVYPNIIIAGGWASWMGGVFGYDHVVAQCSYHRKTSANISGSKVTAHTLHANAHVTNLNFPNGAYLSYTNVSAIGEFFNALVQIPQLAYEDLSQDNYEGSINLVEATWDGSVTLGQVINITHDLPQFAAMNAVIQRISGVIKTGAIFYTLTIGPNKSISPDQFKQRMEAARWRYITSLFFPVGSTGSLPLPQQDATDSVSEAHPAQSEQNVFDPDPNNPGSGGLATLTGNGGNSGLSLGYMTPAGTQDPTKPSVSLNLNDITS